VFSTFLAAVTAPAKAAAAAATALPLQLPPQALPTLDYRPQTWLQAHAGWLTHAFAGLFIICAVVMIALLASQTTKQEGLSGTIGGRVESAYRGRLGFDGQLVRITGMVAVAFVVVATLVSLSGI
jgi:protein translocase SecG subunit